MGMASSGAPPSSVSTILAWASPVMPCWGAKRAWRFFPASSAMIWLLGLEEESMEAWLHKSPMRACLSQAGGSALSCWIPGIPCFIAHHNKELLCEGQVLLLPQVADVPGSLIGIALLELPDALASFLRPLLRNLSGIQCLF